MGAPCGCHNDQWAGAAMLGQSYAVESCSISCVPYKYPMDVHVGKTLAHD